jgi:Tol biopolymer transport system component
MRRINAALCLAGLAACDEPPASPSGTGAITVTTSTLGSPVDPDGYVLDLDGRDRTMAASGTLTLTDLLPGDHRLELRGIASNCALTGPNPRSITVEAGSSVEVGLQITCQSDRGSIAVSATTSGADPDLDGYTLALDGRAGPPIGSNGLVTLSDLTAGDHELALASIAANCVAQGDNPRGVKVTAGAATAVTFAVACHSTGPGTLLLTSDRSGETQIYRIEPDGSGLADLTPDGRAYGGDWSPDRSRIVFASPSGEGSGVYVMDADGTNRVRLAAGSSPVWSPDGSRIAFVSADGVTVMNTDGSDTRALTAGVDPTWSPDGARLAVSRLRCVADICGSDLFVVNADGSGLRQLVQGSPFDTADDPAWSPDGTRIAFTRRCCFLGGEANGLYTVGPDSDQFTQPRLLHRGQGVGGPVWAPDGSAIAFGEEHGNHNIEVMIIPAAGGEPNLLAGSPGTDTPTSWR